MRAILTGTAVLFAMSTPALAQNTICGGISLVGEWVGGDEAGSDLTQAGTAFDADGQVPIAGHLVRMFTLSEETEVRIDVAAQPAGDPYISVYDADGTEVAADDDSAGNFASRVSSFLPAGTYCLAARSYESGVTDVSVRVGRTDHDWPDDANTAAPTVAPDSNTGGGVGASCFDPGMIDLAANADIATLSASPSATGTATTNPAYGLSLTESTPLTITATSLDGDPLIRLIDRAGNVLAENDDFEGLNSQIDMTGALDAGEYCVEVEDLNGATNDITVAVTIFDPVADRLRRINLAEIAPTAADSVQITDLGSIDTAILQEVQASSDASWFTFTLPGGLLVTEVIGDGADPVLAIFDRVGRKIGENDDGPDGLDSFLATRLLPGSYTVAVRLLDEGDRSNVRLLMERFVPAQ